MRVSLTDAGFDPDPLSVPLKSFTRVNLDGNDRVTVEDKTDASGANLDHGSYINPYLRCKASGRVNDIAPDELLPSKPGPTGALQTKVCARCSQAKALSEFYKRRASVDGLQAYCKICHKKQAAGWRKDNPERWQQIQARSAGRKS